MPLSTDSLEDLMVSGDTYSHQKTLQMAQTHGAAIIPSLISQETAQAFRDFVMEANHKLDPIYVLHARHRHHIMPDYTEPITKQLFKEVGNHSVLKPLLDDLLGPQSTLVSFSVITSEYGAEAQSWHGDTYLSAAGYPDLFVPEYTVAIALQNVSKEMGATGICPGTHKCSGSWNLEKVSDHCHLSATMNQGDALVYNSDLRHRGNKHVDPNGPERAIIFFTFAGSRQGPHDNRSLPTGTIHSLKWSGWGRTIDGCSNIDREPWTIWIALGLSHGRAGVRPWSLVDAVLQIFSGKSETAIVISNEFDRKFFVRLVDNMLYKYGFLVFVGYVMTVMPLVFVWILVSSSNINSSKSICGHEAHASDRRATAESS